MKLSRFIYPLLGVGLVLGIVLPPTASAEKTFGPPPPHVQRIGARLFHVDPTWYDLIKDQICPGKNTGVKHKYVQADKGYLVECEQNTFFTPEVPNASGAKAFGSPPKPVIKKVVQTVTKTHVRKGPVLFWSFIYLIIGGVVGSIIGGVTVLIKTR